MSKVKLTETSYLLKLTKTGFCFTDKQPACVIRNMAGGGCWRRRLLEEVTSAPPRENNCRLSILLSADE